MIKMPKYPTRAELRTLGNGITFGYPEELITKLKSAYPDWKDLHDTLDEKDYHVGTLLEYYAERLSPTRDEIRTAVQSGDINNLEEQWAAMDKCDDCHKTWNYWMYCQDNSYY